MLLESEAHVVCHEQVQVPVTVNVQETSARTDVIADTHSGGSGYVSKSPVAVVSIQNIWPKIIHVDVRVPVVVIIPDAHPKRVAGAADAGLLSHVREMPIAVVSVESVSRSRSIGTRKRPPIQKVNINLAIPIIVEKRQPTGDGLHDVPSPGTSVGVDEGDASLARDVAELDRAVRLGSSKRASEKQC